PADGFASSQTTCRVSGGACDSAETCTGSSTDCPADVLASSATTCRSSQAVCDAAEHCDGTSAACPANSFAPTTTVCRTPNGICDVAEHCTGTAIQCPANVFAPSSALCRAAAGDCDVAESCSGTSQFCPGNTFKPAGSTCGNSGDTECDDPDECDGGGTCASNSAADGSACNDDSICSSDQCSAGTCVSEPSADCPLLPIGQAPGDAFGAATALTADYLVVGAPASGNQGSGKVHVFVPSGESYVEQTQQAPIAVPFTDATAASGADFGTSVDADANTIVVGAPSDVVAGEPVSSGSASVFFWNGTAWDLQQKLVDASGLCIGLGSDVAISGDTIVLGAPGGDCALVFERAGGVWSLADQLNGAAGTRFGASVDVSGDSILVGAPGATSGDTCAAGEEVLAFHRGVSGWSLEDTIERPGDECFTQFGAVVALDGNTGVV